MNDNTGNSPSTEDVKDQKTTEEAPIETKEEDYSYDDVHKQTTEQIAKGETTEEIENDVEKKAKEEAEAKAKAGEEGGEDKKEEEEVEFDPKKLVEEVSNAVIEKLSATDESKKKIDTEIKDDYQEWYDKVTKDTGKNPTWKEAVEFVKEKAVEEIKAEQENQRREAEKAAEEERKANEEVAKKLNANIDEEIEELYKNGELTPIKDKNNPSDQGVVERKALFQAMLEVNQKRAEAGQTPILSISRIFYGGYYKKPSAQPAGEDAPVSVGKGATPTGGESEELDYMKDVHNKPWSGFRIPKIGGK
jgi:hypothetical protein